jgi:hypothetical protein
MFNFVINIVHYYEKEKANTVSKTPENIGTTG